jgi:ribosome-binding ATPase YchF (GTP1/OBG family)
MQALTYKDIIDDKIAEWQRDLEKLQERAGKAASDTRSGLNEKMEQLGAAIDSAIVQLHNLDEQETADNTMETKDEILKIFNSIDKDFQGFEDKTPFML